MASSKVSALPVASTPLAGTELYYIVQSGASKQVTASNVQRVLLSAARSYYIRTDGSDSNDGLTNTAGGAFLTMAHAVAVVTGTLDFGGQTVTINLQNTTWTTQFSISSGWTGKGILILDGNGSTISTTSQSAISCSAADQGGLFYFRNLTLTTTTSGSCVSVSGVSNVQGGTSITYGAAATDHITVTGVGAQYSGFDNYTITGGTGSCHANVADGGYLSIGFVTVTMSGTQNYPFAFCAATRSAIVDFQSATFSGGTITGTRYDVEQVSMIYTASGGSATYFPGNAAGFSGSGGVYV